MFYYPKAGRNAPPEVQAAIERFRMIPPAEKANVPLLYWLLGDSTPAYKMSKEDSAYQSPTPVVGQTCGNCRFAYRNVVGKFFICSQIDGRIAPEAWCRLWRGR